jgi:hypothetical protein
MTTVRPLCSTAVAILLLAGCTEDHDRPYLNVAPLTPSQIAMSPDRTLLTQLTAGSAPATEPSPEPIKIASLDGTVPAPTGAPIPLAPAGPATEPAQLVPAAVAPPPEPAAPPSPPVWDVPVPIWASDLVAQWAASEHRQVAWDTDGHDWRIKFSGPIQGSLEDAIGKLFLGLDSTTPHPHLETRENNVLHVTADY